MSHTTKAARQAARQAMVATQEELVRQARANEDDLAAFFAAKQRAEDVDTWLQDRVKALHAQAEKRRIEEHHRCGTALRALRARGQSLVELARLTGVPQRGVRDLIKLAEQSSAAPDEKPAPVGGIATRELHQHRVTAADESTETGAVENAGPATQTGGAPVNGGVPESIGAASAI
jgi:hypothetical protein